MANFSRLAALSIIGTLGLFFGATSVVGAQQAAPTCNGLDATIVVSFDIDGPIIVSGEATVERGAAQGTSGPDVIVATSAGNFETFSAVVGNSGDDVICSTNVNLTNGGEGNDTIYAIGSRVSVLGGNGDDTIYGSDRGESAIFIQELFGGPGDDIIYGGDGNDDIYGDDSTGDAGGNDTIYGRAGSDLLVGGGGSDTIYGGWGNDRIYGGDGFGGRSPSIDLGDILYGGPGDDELLGQLGADTLYGGDGNDHLVSNEDESFDAFGDVEMATGNVDSAGSRMFGGRGDDQLVGSNRWDRMQGGPGNDQLRGFEGRDWMRGGPGNDVLIGGAGIDDMNGNTGGDRIVILGSDIVTGGYGFDRCEAFVLPANAQIRSCERINTIPRETPVLDGLRSGDCLVGLLDPANDSAIEPVNCDVAHDYEVFREALIAASITTFDEGAILSYADEVCTESLAAYLPQNDQNIQFVTLIPTEFSWNDVRDPDRVVTCLLFGADGVPLVGRAA